MSKENLILDTQDLNNTEVATLEVVKLDDLALALVGGGAAGVEF